MYKIFDREEFRLWLIDRFTPEEILDYFDISIEDLLDAFPDQWEENEDLMLLAGIVPIEDED